MNEKANVPTFLAPFNSNFVLYLTQSGDPYMILYISLQELFRNSSTSLHACFRGTPFSS
jgi:hypothetical protein